MGFWGEAPNGNSELKQNGIHKLLNPLGRSPKNGVQGDYPPAGVWGGAPHRPPPPAPSHGFVARLSNRAFEPPCRVQYHSSRARDSWVALCARLAVNAA